MRGSRKFCQRGSNTEGFFFFGGGGGGLLLLLMGWRDERNAT